jgi:hypothetical protein
MTTIALSTMRSRLRTFLNDAQSRLWPNDTDLDLFLNMAIVKFTTDVPIESATGYTVATDQVGDAHTYYLPDDFVKDRFVRGYFEGSAHIETISRLTMQFGAWTTNDEPRGYLVDFPSEGYLYLPRSPQGTTFTLYYGAYSTTELSADEDTYNLRRHGWGEQAIYAYAAYLAFNPSSSRRAQLEQWARKQDLKVGNPLEREAERWLSMYNMLLQEHGGAPSVYEFLTTGRQ